MIPFNSVLVIKYNFGRAIINFYWRWFKQVQNCEFFQLQCLVKEASVSRFYSDKAYVLQTFSQVNPKHIFKLFPTRL